MANGTIHVMSTNDMDQCLIVPTRHFFSRAFNAGTWTEIGFGLSWAFCLAGTTETNAATATSDYDASSILNQIYLGFMRSDIQDIPGNPDQYYLGTAFKSTNLLFSTNGTSMTCRYLRATCYKDGTKTDSGATGVECRPARGSASLTPFMVYLTKNEASDQMTVKIHSNVDNPGFDQNLADNSIEELEIWMDEAAAGTSNLRTDSFVVPWDFDTLPEMDAIVAYNGSGTNQMRIHSYMIKKYA